MLWPLRKRTHIICFNLYWKLGWFFFPSKKLREYIVSLITEIILENCTKLTGGLEWWKSPDAIIIEKTLWIDGPLL